MATATETNLTQHIIGLEQEYIVSRTSGRRLCSCAAKA